MQSNQAQAASKQICQMPAPQLTPSQQQQKQQQQQLQAIQTSVSSQLEQQYWMLSTVLQAFHGVQSSPQQQ
jgi:hypothetical protein